MRIYKAVIEVELQAKYAEAAEKKLGRLLAGKDKVWANQDAKMNVNIVSFEAITEDIVGEPVAEVAAE